MTANVGDVWHRFESYNSCSADEWDRIVSTTTHIRHMKWKVVKVTPKGVWIGHDCGSFHTRQRWVGYGHTKQYASPSEEIAKGHFKARKNAQIRIYTARIESAKEALRIIDTGKSSSLFY